MQWLRTGYANMTDLFSRDIAVDYMQGFVRGKSMEDRPRHQEMIAIDTEYVNGMVLARNVHPGWLCDIGDVVHKDRVEAIRALLVQPPLIPESGKSVLSGNADIGQARRRRHKKPKMTEKAKPSSKVKAKARDQELLSIDDICSNSDLGKQSVQEAMQASMWS